jgi:hypothetical protein
MGSGVQALTWSAVKAESATYRTERKKTSVTSAASRGSQAREGDVHPAM